MSALSNYVQIQKCVVTLGGWCSSVFGFESSEQSSLCRNPVHLVLFRSVFGNAAGGVRVRSQCPGMERWVTTQAGTTTVMDECYERCDADPLLFCCRRQLYWIQSRIQVPCGQVSFSFYSILVRLSYTGINWTGCLVLQVIEMPEHNPKQMGGTMRLGKRRTVFKSDTSVMSMERLKAIIYLLLFALLQCLINNFYRKTLRECGFYRRETQTQIRGNVLFVFLFCFF